MSCAYDTPISPADVLLSNVFLSSISPLIPPAAWRHSTLSHLPRRALEAYHDALAAVKQISDLEARIATLQATGDLHLRFGHDDRAEHVWRAAYKALTASRQSRQKVPREARAQLVTRLRRARRRRHRRVLAGALQDVIATLEDAQPLAPVVSVSQSQPQSQSQLPAHRAWALRLAKAHEYLGDTLSDLGEPGTAAEHYAACLATGRTHGVALPVATLQSALAFALLQAGQYSASAEAYDTELTMRRERLERFDDNGADDNASSIASRNRAHLRLADALVGRAEATLAQVAGAAGRVKRSSTLAEAGTADSQLLAAEAAAAAGIYLNEAVDHALATLSKDKSPSAETLARLRECMEKRQRLALYRKHEVGEGDHEAVAVAAAWTRVATLLGEDENGVESDMEVSSVTSAMSTTSSNSGDDSHDVPALSALLPADCEVRDLPSDDEGAASNNDDTTLELTDSDPEREAREAARRSKRDKAKLLRRNELGETPLQQAARKGQVNVVSDLLSRGAPVNSRDNAGWTALHDAVRQEHDDVVEVLLAWPGIDVHVRSSDDQHGLTPLHDAADLGLERTAAALLAAGADCSRVDVRNLTPLDLAADGGHDGVVALFRAQLAAKGEVGWETTADYLAHRAALRAAASAAMGEDGSAANEGERV